MVMSGVSGTYANHGSRDDRSRHRRPNFAGSLAGPPRWRPRPPWRSTPRPRRCRPPGEHVIGFGAGEPDFPTPAHIVEAAVEACRDPANHRYTPTGGHPGPARGHRGQDAAGLGLRGDGAAGAGDQRRQAGRGQRLRRAVRPRRRGPRAGPVLDDLSRVDRPGRRACPVVVSSDETHRVPLDRSRISRRRWTPRTKALLFVSPSNPTGAVYPRDEIEAIGRWAVDQGLWVLTDEIYEHLVYGGAEHHSMPVLVPELADRCLVANGVAKTYAMTGWRVGWLIGPDRRHRGGHQHPEPRDLQRGQRVPARRAGRGVGRARGRGHDAGGLRPPPPDHRPHAQRDRRAWCASSPRARSTPTRRSRACWASRSGDSVRRRSAELAELCINEAKVAVVPGEAFGAPGLLPHVLRAWGTTTWSKACPGWPTLFAEAQD